MCSQTSSQTLFSNAELAVVHMRPHLEHLIDHSTLHVHYDGPGLSEGVRVSEGESERVSEVTLP